MKLEKIEDIVGINPLPWEAIPVLQSLRDRVKGEECFVATYCYLYGFIQGKRAERSRRRKGGVAQ